MPIHADEDVTAPTPMMMPSMGEKPWTLLRSKLLMGSRMLAGTSCRQRLPTGSLPKRLFFAARSVIDNLPSDNRMNRAPWRQ
jgi:hypothetical protein